MLMIALLLVFLLALTVVLLAQQRVLIYERLISLLTIDRDAAREECKTLRGVLYPKMNPQAKVEDSRKPNGTNTSPRKPLWNSNIPLRKQLRNLVAKHNTQQAATDRLTEAVAQGDQANGQAS